MKILILILSLPVFLSSCATSASIVNSSPGFVVIESPRLSGCGQLITNIAQEHCNKTGKNAVFVDGWVKPFQSDVCRYECKN
jgi:hypothetical protein